MDKDVAAEVGEITALVARLDWELHLSYRPSRLWVDESVDGDCFAYINITKTARAKRIPALRRLADRLRAELKEQKK